MLTVSGTLRDIKAMETNNKAQDANNGLAGQILSLLGEWRFRPAYRDKAPVDIEVVLIIPPVA